MQLTVAANAHWEIPGPEEWHAGPGAPCTIPAGREGKVGCTWIRLISRDRHYTTIALGRGKQ